MDLLDREARLGLREHVPVAVVIVADVLVIELDHRRALVGRAEPAAVPARDLVDAVGVERGDEQEDGFLQDGAVARRVLGDQAIEKLHGG